MATCRGGSTSSKNGGSDFRLNERQQTAGRGPAGLDVVIDSVTDGILTIGDSG